MHCISKFAVIWRRWLLALYSCCLVARKLIFNLLEGKGECYFPQTPSPLMFCSLYTRILCGAMKSFLTLSYVVTQTSLGKWLQSSFLTLLKGCKKNPK